MLKVRLLAAAALIAAPVIIACGSSSSGPGTGDTSGDGGPGTGNQTGGDSGSTTPPSGGGGDSGMPSGSFQEGAHPSFPTITAHGVSTISAPKVVAVTFNGDTNASAVGSFVSSFGTTPWWQAVTKDYSIGAATGSSVAVTATLASGYSDDPSGTLADGGTPTFPGFVASTVTTAPGMPAPDASTIYVFYMPATSPITLQGHTTCTETGGYHSSTTSGGKTIVYAVIPECANATLGSRKFNSETDFLTFASSHEIIEAASDPSASFSAAGALTAGYYNDFIDTPVDDYAWNVLSDGEVADFCVDQFAFTSYSDTAAAGSNVVQRSWSISAATAGKNPCVPVPSGEVYFNAGPAEGSDIFIIPAANMATDLTIQAFSDGPTSAWSVVALDGAVAQGQAAQLTMSFAGGSMESEPGLKLAALPAASVNNGTSVKLSITLTAALDANTNPVAPGILISHDGASLVGAKTDHYWPFLVTTQAIAKQIGLALPAPKGLRAVPPRSFNSILQGLRTVE
ncbi:MAG TPA: hypothetical protein VGI39_10340 [Polyangiaceae bacterium]|jgi:hypothetical protein